MEPSITHAQLICGEFFGLIDGLLLELERVEDVSDVEGMTASCVQSDVSGL